MEREDTEGAGLYPEAANDDDAMWLAENSDLSPNQAREVVRKHGRDRSRLLEVARTIKAES